MGLPTIGIVTAANQKPLATALHDAGAIDLIGEWREVTLARVETAITSLLGSAHQRRSMSATSARLSDGKGVFRLSAVLDGTKITQALNDW